MATLKELRSEIGMTQHQLSVESGLRQATVSGLENGRTKAQSGTVHALSTALRQPPKVVREALAEAELLAPKIESAGAKGESKAESFDVATLGKLIWNWKNAQRAAEGHSKQWKEAMMFLDPILKKHPEFLEARQLMRNAEVEAALKIPLSDRIPPPQTYIGKAHKLVEDGQPLQAIEVLEEKVFVYLPTNIKANEVLFEAATAAALPRTARFALEFAASKNPNDSSIFQRLADYYHKIGELETACEALKQVTLINPDDLEAAKAHRDMIARASMQGGKIERKNKSATIELERRKRFALTDDQKEKEIKKLVSNFQEHGESEDSTVASEAKAGLRQAVKFARELGETNVAALEHALELQHLLANAFPQDPVLVSQIDELNVEIHERKLATAEAKTDDQRTENDQANIDQLRSEKAYAQLEAAERAALGNPTNAEAQLQLGKAYFEIQKFREAVKPLQKAKKDPRNGIDIEAMSLLSDCFVEGNLIELARKEIDEALQKLDSDSSEDDNFQWKNLSYKKATLFLKTDRADDATEVFSEIYAKDSGFKDVEERVWGGSSS